MRLNVRIVWIRILVFCVVLVPATGVSADRVILKAESLLDLKGGRLVRPAVVVIEDQKIISVNPKLIPEGQILDLGDLTLLPGLMDMHTHLCSDLEGDWRHRSVKEIPADRALRGARNAGRTLRAGFTTVRDVGSDGFADVSLMKAIDAGLIEGPRMFPSAHSLGITGGHCDVTGFAPGIAESGPEAGVADGVDEVLRAVRYQIKHGAKVIKICATSGVLSHEDTVGAQQYSFEEMKAIVEEAARHNIGVAAHAHGTDGIIAAVRAGVASIEHGSILTPEAIRLMKKHGTYLVPTSYLADVIDLENMDPVMRTKAEYVLPIMRRSHAQAIKAGVKIAFGTDSGVYPHGDNGKEFAVLVDLGMSPLQAIRSATTEAAKLLRIKDRGRIEAGLLADLIAVSGNPLQDIRTLENIRFVMKGGQVYKKP